MRARLSASLIVNIKASLRSTISCSTSFLTALDALAKVLGPSKRGDQEAGNFCHGVAHTLELASSRASAEQPLLRAQWIAEFGHMDKLNDFQFSVLLLILECTVKEIVADISTSMIRDLRLNAMLAHVLLQLTQ